MSAIDPKQYIEKQRQDWNRVASAWEKWDQYLEENLSYVSYRLIGDLRLRAGQAVLDLGCGTGNPSILVSRIVGDSGSVVGVDLSENMLSVARKKAEALGLSNVSFIAEDVTTLPFENESFDAVISRFCLMFLPDIPQAMKEILRVLRPGGYVATAVWSTPDKNPFIRIAVEVLKQFTEVPSPVPGQPGIFRLSKPADLLNMMKDAGLSGVADEEISGESIFDSAEEYLLNIKDMAAPLKPLFAKLSPEQASEVDTKIKESVSKYKAGDKILLPMAFRVVVGRKAL